MDSVIVANLSHVEASNV